MTENERRGSPKNRWTRRYMWLAYRGGVLVVIAVVIVVLATGHGDGETVTIYHSTATVSHQPTPTISPAELSDLQFVADAEGITLDESIARYAWGDDISMMVTAIEDDDPDSVVDFAITGGSSARIKLSGSISGSAQDAIDKFKSDYPHVEISVESRRMAHNDPMYEGAMHGWCPPDSRVYNEAQAERAWTRLLALFESALA